MPQPRHAPGGDVPAEDSAEDLYEHAPCGYLSTRPDGTIVRVNRTFLDWTGHERDALVGATRFQDLLSPGGRIYHETHYAPLLRMQGSVREIALEIVCADGRRLPVLVNSVLRLDAAGRPDLMRIAVFNATDRQRYELELLLSRERSALLADLGRALDEAQGVDERIRRLTEVLVPRLADRADLEPLDGPLGATRPRLSDEGDCVAIPLRGSTRKPAALVLRHDDDGRRFDETHLGFLEELGARAALSIENARLYEQQRDVAHTLQRSLLAGHAPVDDRYRVGTHYRAAVATLEVGGDWYDTFPLAQDRVAIVVGDVVGRGIEAASAMGQLRSAVRALGGADLGPAALLERLDVFAGRVEAAWMATLVYAEVDLVSGATRFACAGHPPPVLLHPGEPATIVWDGRSTPLRAHTKAVARAEGALTLRPGSRLVLYTDGLVERRDRALDTGIEALVAELERVRAEEPAVVVDEVTAAMLREQDGEDDVCVLCFENAG